MDTGPAISDIAARLAVDDDAIGQAYALLAPTVLGYLRRVVPPGDAEDVLQHTFLDVWRCREQYDASRSLAAWVMGIAKHRAADQLRSRRPEPVADLPQDSALIADDLAERFARSQQIRDALATISPEQRQVLMLVYFDDLSLSQVAEWVGAPLGTVKARAARGLRALAAALEGAPR
ncbi:sigma-70 family RNA polymerase sigma factor [Mycobacterium sp.]|uniref:RNA polymerase sigma factor n=1 Tax=Mycobacterium sp. TaxID=1785 RepID=UPI002C66A4B9|nr:sigma-70 family RNA polymerase sigma factor [Mycobacterium sp.]HTQ20669.1 sigma-70 family RNA polymerase sigma factor [Mycobacterium sp.]